MVLLFGSGFSFNDVGQVLSASKVKTQQTKESEQKFGPWWWGYWLPMQQNADKLEMLLVDSDSVLGNGVAPVLDRAALPTAKLEAFGAPALLWRAKQQQQQRPPSKAVIPV